MCQECRCSPCLSRCPNAPEPKAIYDCGHCHEGIAEGDRCAEIKSKHYHLECLYDMGTADLLELCGIEIREA